MKKTLFPVLTVLTLLTSVVAGAEEKPTVSFCQTEESGVEDVGETALQNTKCRLAELTHDDKVVMKNFEDFAAVLRNAYTKEKSITANEVRDICVSLEFAADKHRLQTRKNLEKTPYISHPIGVAFNLVSIGEVRDTSVIIGALLHDTVEDTQTTFNEIEEKFGKKVASYVRELTDDKSLGAEVRKRLQIVNASHKSEGAAQIKLADKLYNLNDLLKAPPADWTQGRIDRYYEWAQSVVDRLPKANDKLSTAVDEIINAYWEKQQTAKS